MKAVLRTTIAKPDVLRHLHNDLIGLLCKLVDAAVEDGVDSYPYVELSSPQEFECLIIRPADKEPIRVSGFHNDPFPDLERLGFVEILGKNQLGEEQLFITESANKRVNYERSGWLRKQWIHRGPLLWAAALTLVALVGGTIAVLANLTQLLEFLARLF